MGLTSLTGMILKAKFRPLVEPAIPGIVDLLKGNKWRIQIACADALLTLSEQGKPINLSGLTCSLT